MTTPLFLLRCVQLGLSMSDLDFLTIGLVNDMFTFQCLGQLGGIAADFYGDAFDSISHTISPPYQNLSKKSWKY